MIAHIAIFNIVLILLIKISVVLYINNKKKGRDNNIFCKKCRDYFTFNSKIKKPPTTTVFDIQDIVLLI